MSRLEKYCLQWKKDQSLIWTGLLLFLLWLWIIGFFDGSYAGLSRCLGIWMSFLFVIAVGISDNNFLICFSLKFGHGCISVVVNVAWCRYCRCR